jgi:chromosome segregation ATPase
MTSKHKAQQAIDAFWAALSRHIETEDVDTAAATDALCSTLAGIAAADRIENLRAATDAFTTAHDESLKQMGGARAWTRDNYRFRTGPIQEAIDLCVVEFPAAAALQAAKDQAGEAAADLAAARAALEDAISAADLDRVTDLRTRVEQTLPERLDEARHRVLQLEVELRQAETVIPGQRVTAAQTEAEQSQKDLLEADRRFQEANERRDRARSAVPVQATLDTAARERLAASQQELADFEEAMRQAASRRFRQLAGLTA